MTSVVVEALDVVLPEGVAMLHLNEGERFSSRVLDAVRGPNGNVYGPTRGHIGHLAVERDNAGPRNHEPVLGAMTVPLVAEAMTGLYGDRLQFVRRTLGEDRVRTPWALALVRHTEQCELPTAEGVTLQPVIEVDGLVKRYRKAPVAAVDGVSFDVATGEFFALLGPNGAGKTTTISVLTTTLLPTAGTVRVAGHDVTDDPAAVRRSVGIIFQQPSLDLHLSGEHNVRLHAILYGLFPYRPSYRAMPAAYRSAVSELAGLLGIERDIFRPVRTLSGGMKRKLEILRSLLHRPRVLFLDEPTAGLDAASRRELWAYLRRVQADSGTTVFLTTHYMEEAERADRVCVIATGRVVAAGSPAELTHRLAGRQLLLLDAADRGRLRAELGARGIAFEDGTPLRITAGDGEAHRLLRMIETPLTVVRTHAPTLEDAYLDIVGPPREDRGDE